MNKVVKGLQIACVAIFGAILVALSIFIFASTNSSTEIAAGEDSHMHAQGITVDGNMPAVVTSGTCAVCGKALSATHAYVKIANETDLARVFKNAEAQTYGRTSCYHVTTKLTADTTAWGFAPVSLGKTAAAPFQGIFDFGGSTLVTNAATVKAANNVHGLFPYLSGAKVYGLNVQNTGVNGAIFYQANDSSIISDCTVQTTHDEANYGGQGCIGAYLNSGSIIRDCEVTLVFPKAGQDMDVANGKDEDGNQLYRQTEFEYYFHTFGGIVYQNSKGTIERCTVHFTKGKARYQQNCGGAVGVNYGYISNVNVIYDDDFSPGIQARYVNGLAFAYIGSGGLAPIEMGILDDFGEPLRYHIYNVHVTYNKLYAPTYNVAHSAYWNAPGIFAGCLTNSTTEYPLVMQYCTAMGNEATLQWDTSGVSTNGGIRNGGVFIGSNLGSCELYACMTYFKRGYNTSNQYNGGGFMGNIIYNNGGSGHNVTLRRCYIIGDRVVTNQNINGFVPNTSSNITVEDCGIYLNTLGPCRNDLYYVGANGGTEVNTIRIQNNTFYAMNRMTNGAYLTGAAGGAAKTIITGNEYVSMNYNTNVGYSTTFGNPESMAENNTVLNSSAERAIASRIVAEMIENPPNLKRAWSDPDKIKKVISRSVGIDASKQEATCTLKIDKTEFAGATIENLYISVNGTGFGAYTQLVSEGKVIASKEMGKAFGTVLGKISDSFNQIVFTYSSPQTDVNKIVIKADIVKADGTKGSYYVLQDTVVMI